MNIDDTDLTGLDLEAAREYILAYSVDLKRMDKEAAETRAELERWRSRVALAESKLAAAPSDAALAGLAEAARGKVAEAEGKLGPLEAERTELRGAIARMKEQLPTIAAGERSIDPDRLLAELQLMTGELLDDEGGRSTRTAEADLAKLEAEARAASELEALKRRAAGSSGGADINAGGNAGGNTGGAS